MGSRLAKLARVKVQRSRRLCRRRERSQGRRGDLVAPRGFGGTGRLLEVTFAGAALAA